MTIYSLYIKTHLKTGLKYLGQTSKDPMIYCGSGIDWKKHLREHGNDITTQILYQGSDREEMKRLGRYYSDLWEVAKSSEWANRIPETGGGSTPSDETRKIISEKLTGKKKPPRNPEHTEKIAVQLRGKSNLKTSIGLKHYFAENGYSKETAKKQSKSLKEWYDNNPELSRKKGLKSRDGRYLKQYEEYKIVIALISKGYGVKSIRKKTGMHLKRESIEKLRSGKHRIYELFPDLIKILVV